MGRLSLNNAWPGTEIKLGNIGLLLLWLLSPASLIISFSFLSLSDRILSSMLGLELTSLISETRIFLVEISPIKISQNINFSKIRSTEIFEKNAGRIYVQKTSLKIRVISAYALESLTGINIRYLTSILKFSTNKCR